MDICIYCGLNWPSCWCPSRTDSDRFANNKQPYSAALSQKNTARENNIPDHITTIIRGKMTKPLSMQINHLAGDIAHELYTERNHYSNEEMHAYIERKLTSFMLTYQENLLRKTDDRI